jgi:hypothetical protein
MSPRPIGEYGEYATPSRVVELREQMAQIEGRLMEKIDRQGRELAELKQAQLDSMRAAIRAQIDILGALTGTPIDTRKEPPA